MQYETLGAGNETKPNFQLHDHDSVTLIISGRTPAWPAMAPDKDQNASIR